LLGQSKLESLTLFRDVNQERVATLLVTVAHYNCPVEDDGMGFTYSYVKGSVIMNQRGDRIQNFKVLAYYETAKCTRDQSAWLGK